jgi:hypothetical protein
MHTRRSFPAHLAALFTSLALIATASLEGADATGAPSEQLEAQFKATMTGATMAGHSSAIKDGAVAPEKDDTYSIVSVEKVSGSSWVINARMRDAVVPIPVQVKWAGDAAVIIVDNLQIPGGKQYSGSAYSARVMIHGNTYAGSWSGGDHGGLLSGVITNTGK